MGVELLAVGVEVRNHFDVVLSSKDDVRKLEPDRGRPHDDDLVGVHHADLGGGIRVLPRSMGVGPPHVLTQGIRGCRTLGGEKRGEDGQCEDGEELHGGILR